MSQTCRRRSWTRQRWGKWVEQSRSSCGKRQPKFSWSFSAVWSRYLMGRDANRSWGINHSNWIVFDTKQRNAKITVIGGRKKINRVSFKSIKQPPTILACSIITGSLFLKENTAKLTNLTSLTSLLHQSNENQLTGLKQLVCRNVVLAQTLAQR